MAKDKKNNIEILDCFKFLFDDYKYKVSYGGRGSGKCLKTGTKVLMYDGRLLPVEQVKVGDKLMGPDSTPRTVLGTTSGTEMLYKVDQKNGDTYWVTGDHLISLKDMDNFNTINIKASKLSNSKDTLFGYKVDCLHFPEQEDIHLDPYWFGINIIQNKKIPNEYMTSTEKNRLDLLSGLIDAEGKLVDNYFSICFYNYDLAVQCRNLSAHLGFDTSIKHVKSQSKIFEHWDVSINGDLTRIPTRIPRKQAPKSKPNKTFGVTSISVKPDEVGSYHGFELDGDHLFVLEDGTVTHNSHNIARALLLDGLKKKHRILCCRELQGSIKDSVHKLLSDVINSVPLLNEFYEIQQAKITGKNGTEFIFAGLRSNASEIKSLEGITRTWVEEAQSVVKQSWEVLLPTVMRTPDSQIWISMNPRMATDDSYVRWIKNPPPGSITRKINWDQNPYFSPNLKEQMEFLKEKNYEEWDNIWNGNPITNLAGSIYRHEMSDAHKSGRITSVPILPGEPIYSAWDLGYSDKTAIWFYQKSSMEIRCIGYYENSGYGTDHYMNYIKEKYKDQHDISFLPHDAAHKTISNAGNSISAQLHKSGFNNRVVPVSNVATGIENVRRKMPGIFFDETECSIGIDNLRRYRYHISEKNGSTSRSPKHDDTSHGADAFRILCQSLDMHKSVVIPQPVSIDVERLMYDTGW